MLRGFGQIWSKDKIELMLQLEKSLEGEKFIAKEMSKYLANKTNKQIRDKRAEKTYRKRLQEMRDEETNNANPHGTGVVSMIGVEVGEIVTSPPTLVGGTNEIRNRGQLETIQAGSIPEIVISDYSCHSSEEETVWRNNFLQNAIDSHVLPRDSTKETREVIRMLKTALIYAKEENGRVPIQHIDHVYDQITSYIKGENSGPQNQKPNNPKRKKGRSKRAYKRYIYARTQDLYKRNPGELARHVREGIDWYESPNEELKEEEIRQTFEDLWGRAPEIHPPDAMIDLSDLLPPITIGEVKSRIKQKNITPRRHWMES
jgi:hypothetical protein